jgi:SAM-dependent methyltransferase
MTTDPATIPDALARALPLLRDVDEAQARRALRGGVLDLLGDRFAPTPVQRLLDTALSAFLYDHGRGLLVRAARAPRFDEEVDQAARRLGLAHGDVVLDLACGHGNFTCALAERVGPEGLVVGLDISAAMLARAAARVRRRGLSNVLLLRADALDLPFRDASLARLHCAGGLHQLPDLARALGELARVAAPGARLAVSSIARERAAAHAGLGGVLWRRLALHWVPVDELTAGLGRAGFAEVEGEMVGLAMGYAWGRRAETPSAAPGARSQFDARLDPAPPAMPGLPGTPG